MAAGRFPKRPSAEPSFTAPSWIAQTPHLLPALTTLRARAAPMWDRSPPVILFRLHSPGPINPASLPLFEPTAPRSIGPEETRRATLLSPARTLSTGPQQQATRLSRSPVRRA